MKPFAIHIADFSGGLNLKYDDTLMAINEAKDLQNCDPYSKGWIDRRKGCTTLTSDGVGTQTSIDNLIRFYPDSSTKILICSTNNNTANKLYKINDSTGAETEITGGTTLQANTHIRFAIYGGYLFLTDGTAPIQCYTSGTTKADCSGNPLPPVSTYLATHKRRLYGAKDSNLYYSDLGVFSTNPSSDINFPADNVEPIGDVTLPIMGLIPQQDHLVVFKENTIHKWIGDAEYDFRCLDTNRPYGCIAPDSISMCEGWVVFLAHDGVRAYDGGLHCVLLSDKITPIIDGSSAVYGMSTTERDHAQGVYHDGLYRLLYAGRNSTYKNKEILFNFRRWVESNGQVYAWYYNQGRNLNCACVYSAGSDEYELIAGDSAAPYIYELESGYADKVYGSASAGNIIDMYWKSKGIDTFQGAGPHEIKKFRKLKLNTYMQNGEYEISYDVDNARVNSTDVASTADSHYWGQDYWNVNYWGVDVMRQINLGLDDSLVGKSLSVMVREKTARAAAKVHNLEIYGKAKPYK